MAICEAFFLRICLMGTGMLMCFIIATKCTYSQLAPFRRLVNPSEWSVGRAINRGISAAYHRPGSNVTSYVTACGCQLQDLSKTLQPCTTLPIPYFRLISDRKKTLFMGLRMCPIPSNQSNRLGTKPISCLAKCIFIQPKKPQSSTCPFEDSVICSICVPIALFEARAQKSAVLFRT